MNFFFIFFLSETFYLTFEEPYMQYLLKVLFTLKIKSETSPLSSKVTVTASPSGGSGASDSVALSIIPVEEEQVTPFNVVDPSMSADEVSESAYILI